MAKTPASSVTQTRRPRLSDAFSDELRQSVHKFETTRRGRLVDQELPKLPDVLADELRRSVHDMETSKANKYKALQRPRLSGAFTDELQKSVHNRQMKVQKKSFFGRPKLSEAFSDELRQSVHNLKKSSKKKGGLFSSLFGRKKDTSLKASPSSDAIMNPVTEQRTPSNSQRRRTLVTSTDDLPPVQLSPHDETSRNPEQKRLVVVKSPLRSPGNPFRYQQGSGKGRWKKTIPEEMAEELPRSFQSENDQNEQRGRDRKRLSEGRTVQSDSVAQASYGRLSEMDESLASYASFSAEPPPNNEARSKVRRKQGKTKSARRLQSLLHSKSFYEGASSFENPYDTKPTSSSVAGIFSPVGETYTGRSAHSRSLQSLSILHEESNSPHGIGVDDSDVLHETAGDMDAYRREWARLIKEKKGLKNKLVTSRARNTLFIQQINDVSAESADLKSKLKRWKDKAANLLNEQRAERAKVDKTFDFVARSRVELSKAVNESSKLRSKLHHIEKSSTVKDQLIEDLNDTIERQADIIQKLNNKLKDQETTLRLSDDEKRRLEDELAVLIAKRNGNDMRDTFRQLEEDREKFFWQREMDIEAKRIELEKQRDWILEQDKVRHEKDMQRLAMETNREVQVKRERETLQEIMYQQLEDMKVANRDLRDKFARDRADMASELQENEIEIGHLEREVVELQKQLAAQDRSKNDVALCKEEVQSVKEDLRDVQRHKRILEKEIVRLTKKLKQGGKDPDGWREIIFPGYRGVNFGSEDSEALAGFLTILVEERGRRGKSGKKSSIKLQKISEKGESTSRRKRKAISKQSNTAKAGKKSKSRHDASVTKERKTDRDKIKRSKKTTKGHKKKERHDRKAKNAVQRSDMKKRRDDKVYKKKHKSKRRTIGVGNNLTLDENVELLLRETSIGGRPLDIDDMSMLVFKRSQYRSSEQRRSSSHGRSSRRHDRESSFRRRRSRSDPPPEIVLQ